MIVTLLPIVKYHDDSLKRKIRDTFTITIRWQPALHLAAVLTTFFFLAFEQAVVVTPQ